MDPNLNSLLKWSVEAQTNPEAITSEARGALNADALASLFSNGPSDAEMMKISMAAIHDPSPENSLENRLVAFDNFEQLIENLDNANLMEPLNLWGDLLKCLKDEEAEIKKYAAWCVGTAVQNNFKSQTMLVKEGGIKPLVEVATSEKEEESVRRKAIYALSSAMRNMQSAMDAFTEEMKSRGRDFGSVDAGDMDQVDNIIQTLRDEVKGKN